MRLDRARQAVHDGAKAGFSGVVLVTEGEDVLLEEAVGLANRADGVAITPETRFDVASVGKMFVSVALARLVERGAFAFETPLVECLQEELRPRSLSPAVTLHHLLTHTSGVADYADDDDYAAAWRETPSYGVRRAADYVPLFAHLPRAFEPGERFEYCGAGYVLLGLVVEEATGLPFAGVVEQEVFAPAAMSSSGFFALDEIHPRVAVGYVPGERVTTNVFSIPAVGGPDGGAFCTARDLDRFLRAFDSGKLVGPSTRERMLTAHAHDEDGWGYGYGFWLFGEGDDRLHGHTGEDPGGSARVWRRPARDADVIVLANVSEASHPVDLAVQEALGL